MLEALPTFKSESMMTVTWEGTLVQIIQEETSLDQQLSFSIKGFKSSEIEVHQNSVKIHKIIGRELLDSRGYPALEIEMISESEFYSSALVPSGASTGQFEAHELRDLNPLRFHGKGLLKACEKVQKLSEQLKGFEFNTLESLDQKLIEMDGTTQKQILERMLF